MPEMKRTRLFTGCVMALVATAFGFAVRAAILGQWRAEFNLTQEQIGYLLGAFFFLMIITGGWEASVRSIVEGEFEGEGALRVPSWPARWTVMLGSAVAMINYLVMAYLDVFRPELLNTEVDPEITPGA